MKIKIIDLINMTSKGEELPKKIKYKEKIWNYIDYQKDYINEDEEYFFTTLFVKVTDTFINDEVEIKEENNEIEKLNPKDCKWNSEVPVVEKINELIDEINKLKEK